LTTSKSSLITKTYITKQQGIPQEPGKNLATNKKHSYGKLYKWLIIRLLRQDFPMITHFVRNIGTGFSPCLRKRKMPVKEPAFCPPSLKFRRIKVAPPGLPDDYSLRSQYRDRLLALPSQKKNAG